MLLLVDHQIGLMASTRHHTSLATLKSDVIGHTVPDPFDTVK